MAKKCTKRLTGARHTGARRTVARGRGLQPLRVQVRAPRLHRGALPGIGMLLGRVVVSPRARQKNSDGPELNPKAWPRTASMQAAWPHLAATLFVQEQWSTDRAARRVRQASEALPFGFRRRLKGVGSIRCCATTHLASALLTKRTMYDLPACLRFAKVYRQAVGRKWSGRAVVSPAFAEFLCGLPKGWTSASKLPGRTGRYLQPQRARPRTVLDLFSGCLGMALGLREFCRVVAYVEKDAAVRRVIEARARDGVVDVAPVFVDVRDVHAAMLPELPDVLAAGFPCTDVSTAGLRQGFDGPESVLFREELSV